MTSTTEVVATIRQSADDPRLVEGTMVPYGVVARATEIGPETFAPGAFRDAVNKWNARTDGARLPFRPAHKERPVGSVVALRDTPEGVWFQARIREGARGDEYLADVADGLNGVSVEFDAPTLHSVTGRRNGVTVHRQAELYGIAGSVAPAYDGARVAARDMEEAPVADEPATTEAAPAAVAPDQTAAQRDAVLADPVTAAARSTIIITREAAIYGREAATLADGSHPSFLADGWAAAQGNRDAAERQDRYRRATDDLARIMERDAWTAHRAGEVLSSEIPGAYPNDYLPGLLTPAIVKGRPMGGFYDRFPISDATPKIFPKVTTSTTVAVQAGEGTNPAASDFATTLVTTTPALYGAETVVSRQALDGSSPAAEAMIMADMYEAYAQASEAVIKTAVEAGSAASGTAITAATPYAGTAGNVVKYATTRFKPAQGQFMPSALFAVLAAQADSTGRLLLANVGPTNASGQGLTDDNLGYDLLGARGFHSYASTVNVVVTARKADFVIFESPIARFSYDAVTGPAGVRVGIWAYLAVGTRLGSLKVTAA